MEVKKRIIIVEDEALIAAEMKMFLHDLGYQVVGHAMNGDRALDLFAIEKCDIILLDINIKGSLSGIDLARIVREKYNVPFIYITSFSDKMTLEEVKDTDPYGYVIKPFNENDLRVNIELALNKFDMEVQEKTLSREHVEKKFGVTLTERDFSLLEAFKDGLTYKEAGIKMHVSVNTVKTYQKRLFLIFDVASKYELIERLRG